MDLLVDLVTAFFWVYVKIMSFVHLPYIIYQCLTEKKETCPPIRNEILLLSATDLAERIRKKKITSTEVIKAYIARIKEVNPYLNAVVEDRFNDALQEALAVDKILTTANEEEIKIKKPLLGIPITVKGSIAVKGLTHSSGRVDYNVIPSSDPTIVRYVKEAGGIPLLISNTPEYCLAYETTNKLIGTTNNPYNLNRTAGGSSGGECSLLAAGASVVGLGSDMAGSLRLPAHFCGVFSHKPSPKIVPCDGHLPDCKNLAPWQEIFTLGPLARTTADLRLLLEILLEPNAKNIVNLDSKVNMKDVRVYYMKDANSPLMSRVTSEGLNCLQKVIEHLNDVCTVKCEEASIPLMAYGGELNYINMLFLDDVDSIFKGKGEGVYQEVLRFVKGESKHEMHAILYGLLRRNMHLVPKSYRAFLTETQKKLKQHFLNLLRTNGVFIIPTYPTEAHYHGEIWKRWFYGAHMSIFNSLGLPATHCPITFTKTGLPIGVQIVAAPNCDRLCLDVAEELERRFGGWQPKIAL